MGLKNIEPWCDQILQFRQEKVTHWMRFTNLGRFPRSLVLHENCKFYIDHVSSRMQYRFRDADHFDEVVFQSPDSHIRPLRQDRRSVPEIKEKYAARRQ